MKKRIDSEAEEVAFDHNDGDDGDDTGSWLNGMTEIFKRETENRIRRISTWAKTAGPPHAEITLGDDPDYMDRIGFWRVPGGVIRIRASMKGEFDPAERTDITEEEVQAIMDASVCVSPAEVMGCGRATVRMKIRRLKSGTLQCRIPGAGRWHDVDPTDEGMFINPDDSGGKLLETTDRCSK